MTSEYIFTEEHSFATGGSCARSVSVKWFLPESVYLQVEISSSPEGGAFSLNRAEARYVRDALDIFLKE